MKPSTRGILNYTLVIVIFSISSFLIGLWNTDHYIKVIVIVVQVGLIVAVAANRINELKRTFVNITTINEMGVYRQEKVKKVKSTTKDTGVNLKTQTPVGDQIQERASYSSTLVESTYSDRYKIPNTLNETQEV